MTNVTILVGSQWGDEGKGKWVDLLAKDATHVVRFQGGNNAGHTLNIDGKKLVLHQIPSGIFHPHTTCALAGGVVIDPAELVDELAQVETVLAVPPERLWVSAKAHIITPWHRYLDKHAETSSSQPIGTTGRGIGPTYADKANRTGLRMGDYVDVKQRQAWMQRQEGPEFDRCIEQAEDQWERFHNSAERLKPYVCEAEQKLRQAIEDHAPVFFEGAQGAMLDLEHGTYPYVTSSNTLPSAALCSVGFSPRRVGRIVGVSKAYTTRVGEGPFPTELTDQVGATIAKLGQEFGATTGRPRRCGWLDLVALRYAAVSGGYDELVISKMDILAGFDQVKVCTGYHHPDLGKLTDVPSSTDVLGECQPIYESLAGWPSPLVSASGRLSDQAEAFLAYLEAYVGVPVTYVGTGPERTGYLARV